MIVIQEKEKSVFNIETLVNKFRQLGSLSGLAYYGAFAYGDSKLQENTALVYQDLKALHKKYSLTFSSFESTSMEVLQQMETAFNQLQLGETERSIENMKTISGSTAELKTSASRLHQETIACEENVKKLRDNAVRVKAGHEEQRQNLQYQKQKLQAEQARIKKEKENAEAAAKQSKNNADQAQREADDARRKYKKKKRGIGGFFNKLLGKLKKYEKRQKTARNEQHAHEAKLKKHQEEQKKAEQNLAALESKLKELNVDTSSVDEAISSLHEANGEFKSLAILMLDATSYWDGMQSFTNDLLNTLTTTQEEVSGEMKIWESPAFQFKGVQLYAKWLALKQQSSYYLQNTEDVEAQIAGYVSIQQPSPQQAKDMIKKIKSGQGILTPKQIKDEL